VVECQLPKLDVAGSSPVARSPHQVFSQPFLSFTYQPVVPPDAPELRR
jgi:hypothetical protein